jgi:probable DNA repair protein
LDPVLVTAMQSGRDIIVPDRHRAAALRLAWARLKLSEGYSVWSTPRIYTWDAWLAQQWREAAQRGAVTPAQLLDTSQERALWESVLARLAGEGEDEASLTQHAGALMQSAARATQSGIDPARLATSREEKLLVAALEVVRRQCRERNLLSLRLARPDELVFLAQVPAPLVMGMQRLTPLQEQLAARCWPGATLLAVPAAPPPQATPRRLRAGDLGQELAACARWCRAHVERDPGTRLLVLSACTEPSLATQGALLWNALAAGTDADDALRARWLAIEGGEPLLHQALAGDALALLELAVEATPDTAALRTLLRSPYLGLLPDAARLRLAAWLDHQGLARWPRGRLIQALRERAAHEPAAGVLVGWLTEAGALLDGRARRGTTEWARQFTAVLEAAGFARGRPLDSREQQRLARWHELLDEFAGLDAVLPPLSAAGALARLQRLAAQARHQAATGDAAVTLSANLADPVVRYDGIWVLGLAEARWPAAPRPDPWIPLAEQRRARWPEAGAAERREQAAWALARWRTSCADLVLSYPVREGDVVHRPPALAGDPEQWTDCELVAAPALTGRARPAGDARMAPVAMDSGGRVLPGGTKLLAMQQTCPFRAQAEWRLGAAAPVGLSEGVPAFVRGRLLHLVLQHLWERLGGQAALTALDAEAELALVEECWRRAVQATPAARWLLPTALERERQRTRQTVARVLELERQRPPFTVEQCEHAVEWQGGGARLALRIDRIDRVGDEALLIDYKSGEPARNKRHEQILQRLQLALYAAALAQQGRPVSAAALLSLHPHEPKFLGLTAREGILDDGLAAVEDWDATQRGWQEWLVALMQQHLSGEATLTVDRKVCARCHLPALCRRAGEEAMEDADE